MCSINKHIIISEYIFPHLSVSLMSVSVSLSACSPLYVFLRQYIWDRLTINVEYVINKYGIFTQRACLPLY